MFLGMKFEVELSKAFTFNPSDDTEARIKKLETTVNDIQLRTTYIELTTTELSNTTTLLEIATFPRF